MANAGGPFPAILVLHEVFGVHGRGGLLRLKNCWWQNWRQNLTSRPLMEQNVPMGLYLCGEFCQSLSYVKLSQQRAAELVPLQ
jgi:hypothetical protein